MTIIHRKNSSIMLTFSIGSTIHLSHLWQSFCFLSFSLLEVLYFPWRDPFLKPSSSLSKKLHPHTRTIFPQVELFYQLLHSHFSPTTSWHCSGAERQQGRFTLPQSLCTSEAFKAHRSKIFTGNLGISEVHIFHSSCIFLNVRFKQSMLCRSHLLKLSQRLKGQKESWFLHLAASFSYSNKKKPKNLCVDTAARGMMGWVSKCLIPLLMTLPLPGSDLSLFWAHQPKD